MNPSALEITLIVILIAVLTSAVSIVERYENHKRGK